MLLSLIGPLVGLVGKFIDKSVPDKDLAERLKAEFSTQAHELARDELQGAIKIILAEASGGWIQRNWRPILMLVIVCIVANNYLLAPYIQLAFGPQAALTLDLPADLWTLMTIGVGGYIAGRSGERMVQEWKKG